MHFDLYLPLSWTEELSAVELLYAGGELSMVLLVTEDLAAFEAQLHSERLNEILRSISDQGIHLHLPRFSFSSHTTLDDALQGMGMVSAYGAADFSGMGETAGLFLQTVQHEAFIEVDEDGTEAHGSTGAGMAVSHGPTIMFDRPFMFVIRDRSTGAVLFIGRVTDPRG